MNECRQQAQSAIRDSLAEMQRKGVQAYKHDGVELARMPGGEKLRVRVTKDHGDADESDFDAPGVTVDADSVAGEGVSAGD